MSTHTRIVYNALLIAGIVAHAPGMTKTPRDSFHYIMPPDIRAALYAAAKDEERTMSYMLTRVLRRALGIVSGGQKTKETEDTK